MVEPSSGRAVHLHANERDLRPCSTGTSRRWSSLCCIALALLHLHHALLCGQVRCPDAHAALMREAPEWFEQVSRRAHSTAWRLA